jgi:Urocanase Rossmann-like domain
LTTTANKSNPDNKKSGCDRSSRSRFSFVPDLRPDQREDNEKSTGNKRYTRHEVAAPRGVGPSGRTEPLNTNEKLALAKHGVPMQQRSDDKQQTILSIFTLLHSLRQDWGGALIIACGLNPRGAALALASNIAGAVCLSIEDDLTALKEASRSGSCDFIVNTLDEALRAMKNEVRKHLPLSVGLQGNPTAVLQELLERGVSPQLFTDLTHTPNHLEAIKLFQANGALIVNFSQNLSAEGGILDADALIEAFALSQQWHLRSFTFDTPAASRAFDVQALSLLPEDDSLRRRWLQSAPRILQRERPLRRVLWITESEEHALQSP